jgi:hypothetical protein
MSQVPRRTTGDEAELGTLLALLHGANDRYQTVQATYRTWRHEQRLHEAFRANTEDQKRRGVSIAAVSAVSSGGEPAPPATEETVRIWREGQRLREELHDGRRDGTTASPTVHGGGLGRAERRHEQSGQSERAKRCRTAAENDAQSRTAA